MLQHKLNVIAILIPALGAFMAMATKPVLADCPESFVEHHHSSDDVVGTIQDFDEDEEQNIYVILDIFIGPDSGKVMLSNFELIGDYRTSALVKFNKDMEYQWSIKFDRSQSGLTPRVLSINESGNPELFLNFREPPSAIEVENHTFETEAKSGFLWLEIDTEGEVLDGHIPAESSTRQGFSLGYIATNANGTHIMNFSVRDKVNLDGEEIVNEHEEMNTRVIADITDIKQPKKLINFVDGSAFGLSDLQLTHDDDIIFSLGNQNPVYFPEDTIPHHVGHEGLRNILVTRLSPDGDVRWHYHRTSVDSMFGIEVGSFTTDQEGNVYVSGTSPTNIDFGNGVSLEGEKSGGNDGFILKLNSDGEPQWARDFKNHTPLRMDYVYLNDENEIVVGGNFNNMLDFDNDTTLSFPPLDKDQEHLNPFQAKFNKENGNLMGARHFESDSDFVVFSWGESNNYHFIGGANNMQASIYEAIIPKVEPSGNSSRQSFIARICKDDMEKGINLPIENHKKSEVIKVYPNPAKEHLNIDRNQNLDSPPEVKLYNLQGQIVLSETMTNEQFKLDISALQKGMYLLEIKGENQKRFYERVVIE